MNSIINKVQRKRGCFMQSLKLITAVTTVVSSGAFSQIALAACTITGPVERIMNNLNSFDLVVDASRPIGSALGLLQGLDNNPQTDIVCDGPIGPVSFNTEYSPTASGSSAQHFDTGIPGIAMSITSGIWGSNYLPHNFTFNTNSAPINSPSRRLLLGINFWKTSETLSDGQISTAPIIVKATIPNHGHINILNIRLARPINVRLLRPTCSVNTPNYNIDLGQVSIVDLNVSGRTTPKDFNIDLTCTGGTLTTNVHVTLTDANNPTNTSTRLGLSPDSDALGIALEVNNKYGAVTFGPDLEGIGNPGQWLEGAAGVGSFSIPLSVNYVRLPGPIKGGTANAGVTYTINYD